MTTDDLIRCFLDLCLLASELLALTKLTKYSVITSADEDAGIALKTIERTVAEQNLLRLLMGIHELKGPCTHRCLKKIVL